MIVMKFGGEALQNPQSIKKVISVIKASLDEDPVIVLSAFGKSTRMLEGLFDLCSKGDFQETQDIIDTEFLPIALSLFEGELTPEYESDCREDVIDRIGKFKNYISSSERKWNSSDRDYILSQGELITSRIIYYFLNSEGIKSEWLDARDMIITDEKHRFAQPDFKSSVELVKQKVDSCQKDNKLAITQGFIASTPSGSTTTLGYEGSDLSATFIGACIDADRVELYKTVPGVMTADPNLVQDSIIVRRISYGYVEKLTSLGSKILHKNAIQPLIDRNIPLKILSLYEPEDDGTTIEDTRYDDLEYDFFVVGHPDGILVSIQHSDGDDPIESDRIGSILSERDITNVPVENSLEQVQYFLSDKSLLQEAKRQLRDIDNISWIEDVSMIGMIHNSLSENDLTTLISDTFDEYRTKVLASSESADMTILVIPLDQFKQIYNTLHRILIEYSSADVQLMERK